jgi:3'(2'), 5'-bisphosphate nucleotidase
VPVSADSPYDTRYAGYIQPLSRICREAAAGILRHYESAQADEHDLKSDASPLTAADLASHRVLLAGLQPLGLPVLSEESDDAAREQAPGWRRYWLVDPLDGTREFLARTGEFTVNIALIDRGRSVFGLVALPLAGELYLGVPGQGAWKLARPVAGEGEGMEKGEDWQAISCRPLEPGRPLRVLTSRRHRGEKLDACLEAVRRVGLEVERAYVGSALKFCQVAAGEADLYPRFSPCCEWDTAAGQALLEGAGGVVVDLGGKPLGYNRGGSLLNPDFFAIGDENALLPKLAGLPHRD